MKPAQWTGIVLAVAAMVFLITFAMNYLGDSTSPSSPTDPDLGKGPALQLTFGPRLVPEESMPPLECEVKKPTSLDFWYHNENDADLTVGLWSKTCKCTNVELYVLPPQAKTRVLAAVADRMAQAHQGPLALACLLLAQNEPAYLDAEGTAELTPLESKESGRVPAGAVGWIRLKWSGEQARPQDLNADLWSNSKERGPSMALKVRVQFVHPLLAKPHVMAGTFGEQDLPRDLTLFCWSATRSAFRIKAEVTNPRGPASTDPFVLGQPIPLTAAECQQLEKETDRGRILCGYRVPIKLQKVSSDGKTPFDIGPFYRWVQLSSDDEGIEPIVVAVSGTVQGDVSVGGRSADGMVSFGSFDRTKGTQQSVVLQSDLPDLELEVDRYPDFLKVTLLPPEVSQSKHRIWQMRVTVLPNKVRGLFPKSDDPALRDSAIYVKTHEKTPRSIRIPVTGISNDS
jgi:hypothetical protein